MIHRAAEGLTPHEVRARTFRARVQHGLDPDEVYAFLGQVADELSWLERELTTARTETVRIRQGLLHWQSRHVGCRFVDPQPAAAAAFGRGGRSTAGPGDAD